MHLASPFLDTTWLQKHLSTPQYRVVTTVSSPEHGTQIRSHHFSSCPPGLKKIFRSPLFFDRVVVHQWIAPSSSVRRMLHLQLNATCHITTPEDDNGYVCRNVGTPSTFYAAYSRKPKSYVNKLQASNTNSCVCYF